MKAHEVPPDMLAVRCLRCFDHLAISAELTQAERHQAGVDHHLYICAAPTPNVSVWRAAGFPEASRPTPREP